MMRGQSAMFSEAFLHIGTEKTGSTSIQRFLAKNRNELRRRGLFYPVSLGQTNHHLITLYALNNERAASLGNRKLRIAASRALRGARVPAREQIVARFESEVSKLEPEVDRLIISNEHLHSRLSEKDEFLRLRDFLSKFAHRLTVVVYLRRQDRVARSLATTHVKGGRGRAEFPAVEPASLPRYFDYYRIIKEYDEYLKPDRFILRPFDRNAWVDNDLLSDFLAIFGLERDPEYEEIDPKNQSLSPAALDFLSTLGKYVPRHVSGKPNPNRKQLIKLLVQGYGGGGGIEVDRATARAFYQAFEESNRRLSREYFSLDEGCIFDDDFSEYPEKLSGPDDPQDAAARIFGYLWTRTEEKARRLQVQNLVLEARLNLATGDYQKAESAMRAVLAIRPNHPEVKRMLSACQARLDVDPPVQRAVGE